MQLPLTRSSSLVLPAAQASLLVTLALATGFAASEAQARKRRTQAAKAPASSKAAKIRVLEARMRKATATYNGAMKIYSSYTIPLYWGTFTPRPRL